jgi:transcriptional regulator with XRE-family HTH domain
VAITSFLPLESESSSVALLPTTWGMQKWPMPNSPVVPTVRRRRLGSTLRRLRNDAGLTLDEAAAAIGWKAPKLSKIENATQSIRPADVAALLGVLKISDAEVRTALENLAKDAGKKGWWQTYNGIVSPAYADYISLESDADRICEWSPLVVPGLLQTAAYARESIAGITTFRTPDEVAALAEVRQARQSVLSRPGKALDYWTVVHEAALHQRFAVRPSTMRDQLRRLLDAAEMPNVTIQLMPLDSTAHPGVLGGFSRVIFPGPTPDVVLLENLGGETYVEGDDASPFARAFERIRATALPVEDSLARIAQMEEGHRT